MKGKPIRVAVGALVLSVAGFAGWQASEGFNGEPHVPTKGDVPTIGFGSTRYEDGTPVRLTDKPITRERAEQLARNLHSEEETRFRASLLGVSLTQGEYDLYVDFVGQYGIGNWRGSTMRKRLLATTTAAPAEKPGLYRSACNALLNFRFAAGYDCSVLVNGQPNKRCWGSWERQQQRHAKCLAEQ